MHKQRTLGFLSLTCAALLVACGGGGSQAPAPGTGGNGGGAALTIGGTLTVPNGQTVSGAQVLACYQGDCENAKSKQVAASASGAYSLTGLEKVQYGLIAFKDLNGDKNIGAGDLLGQLDDPVTPPAQNVDIALTLQGGGGGGGGTGGTIAGTVTAPQGGNAGGTLIAFCDNENCDGPNSDALQIGATAAASALYESGMLKAGSYTVVVVKDVNGNQKIDAGDYYGFYTKDGNDPAAVTPPATGIDIQMAVLTPGDLGSLGRQALAARIFPHLR